MPEGPPEPRPDSTGDGPDPRPAQPRQASSAAPPGDAGATQKPPKPMLSAAAAAALPPRPPLPADDAPQTVPVVSEEVDTMDAPIPAPVEPADAPAPAAQPETESRPAEEAEPAPEPRPASVIAQVLEPAPASTAHEGEAASTAVPAVAATGLTKTFGQTKAVDGVALTVPAGSFYGLVGPNGAGKTTTLSMIGGLIRPSEGSVRINGVDAVAHPREAKRMLGVLPDRMRTFDRLTGRQLLYYFGVLRELKPAVAESRTADLARAFDLTDALSRPVSDYSAGMRKKVLLAGALIHSPRVLVLDEPFEAVDPVSSAVILDVLDTYVAHGGTVLLSSHGMQLVERVCDRVAVLVAGTVLAEGTVAEVRGKSTLEERFLQLSGGLSDVEGLEWLHAFSD